MKNIAKTDILIVGGGIAGLWLLNLLKKKDFSVVLLEADEIGSGQTGKSQGIIHGGMKYALQGKLTPAAKALHAVPAIWKDCIEGRGEIDLSRVPVLSTKQYLWSTNILHSKVTGLVAKKTLKSHVSTLKKEEFPEVFKNLKFRGHLSAVDELIIDVHSLMYELVQPHFSTIFKIRYSKDTPIQAQKIIFTAGSGNGLLTSKVKMQLRPLHMVMVKHNYDFPLYAHCIGLSNVPRLTITTHKAKDGKTVWYLGGQLAEEGVKLSSSEQIDAAKKELKKLFSWLDFSDASFATFFIDRAENFQANGNKPDTFYMESIDNTIVAWPTKLAFAPNLAHSILTYLDEKNIRPQDYDLTPLKDFSKPSICLPMWDHLLKSEF